MPLFQDGGNVLWRAIKKNHPDNQTQDWNETRRIVSSNPGLLNTVSTSGWTPLMQAAWWNCPDEIIVMMMERAEHQTLLTLNDQCFGLLHAVAKSSLVSATRYLLENTKMDINIQTNEKLNTPLHMCMRDDYVRFEDRYGTIKVLVESGADITIRNKEGRTPIYEFRKNRTVYRYAPDELQQILDVLEGKEIPAEIWARGLDALKLYRKALKEGKSDFNLVRVMVMGQENVGKSCLIDSLLGKKFNKEHIITDAIAITRICMHDKADDTKWTQAEICHKDEIEEMHENALVEDIAKDLRQEYNLRRREVPVVSPMEYAEGRSQTDGVESPKTLEPSDERKRKLSNDDGNPVPEEVSGKGEMKRMKTKTNGATSQASAAASPTEDMKQYPQNIQDKVAKILKGDAVSDRPNSIRIWDYGGQPIYHSIHRFYMTPEGIFIIVFKLSADLDDISIVVDSSGNVHTYYMTNLQHLLYWIRSSYTYTSRNGHAGRYGDGMNFPVCIIVGTHRNSLTGTAEEICKQVKEKFDKIREAIKGKCYESHVYQKYFDVENQDSSDENIKLLSKVILEIKAKMKTIIPHKWLNLLIEIQKLSEDKITLPLEKVKSLAIECGITDDNTIELAITYLSDVGEIMYHPIEKRLCDIVVLQPFELVKYIKTVFTVVKPEFRERNLQKEWRELEEKCVLKKSLLKHLWKKFTIFLDDKDEKMFNFVIALMTNFGLICQRKTSENTDPDDVTYYAVSHLQPERHSASLRDDQGDNKVPIFHDFCGYLPDHLFQLAVTRFIEKFQVEKGPDPKLAYEHAELSIDDHHIVRIAVATINHRRMFKTTIVRRQKKPNSSEVMEPTPKTCKQVLSFLDSVLKALCNTSARGIQYKMCIPCGCSDTFQHMHIVDDFNKVVVPCRAYEWSIERYCRLFGDASKAVSTSLGPLNELTLLYICNELDVHKWKCLGYRLEMTTTEIETILTNCRRSEKDAKMDMLIKWRNKQSSDVNKISVLSNALEQEGYVQIAERLLGKTGHSDVLRDNELLDISEELGTNWKAFGVRLGLKWRYMKELESHQGVLDACMDMLSTWQQQQSIMTNQVDVMCKLLEENGFGAVACKLRPVVDSEAGFLTDKAVINISENLGSNWKRLAVGLGFNRNEVESIAKECESDACMKMLKKWRTRQSCDINQLNVMHKELIKQRHHQLARQLKTI